MPAYLKIEAGVVTAEQTSSWFAKLTSGDFRRMAALTSYFAARVIVPVRV